MAKIKVCTHCGFTWDEFSLRLVLGCPQCYTVFRKELKGYLAEVHGVVSHLHSHWSDVDSRKEKAKVEQLAQLHERLSEAVRQEKFEDALKIKDELRKMESGNI
jgi:protein arginine kinase activator